MQETSTVAVYTHYLRRPLRTWYSASVRLHSRLNGNRDEERTTPFARSNQITRYVEVMFSRVTDSRQRKGRGWKKPDDRQVRQNVERTPGRRSARDGLHSGIPREEPFQFLLLLFFRVRKRAPTRDKNRRRKLTSSSLVGLALPQLCNAGQRSAVLLALFRQERKRRAASLGGPNRGRDLHRRMQ